MTLLFLSLRPEAGCALDSWADLDERVGWLLPRVRAGFGVQEVWAHELFFLRVMFTEMPSPDLPLTIFALGGSDPRNDERHPVWPIVARLAARNRWQAWAREKGGRVPIGVPSQAELQAMPDDDAARLTEAAPAPGIDLSGLDEVAWGELTHAFGTAQDIPDVLRAVASADRHARREAFRCLYGNLYHQGSTYSATVAAVPFLLRVLACPAEGAELDVLQYLSTICERDTQVIRAALPAEALLTGIAARPDEVGLEARRVMACLARVSPSAADQLHGYVRHAPDPVTRADWLLWIAELADAPRWRALLTEHLASPEPWVRLASAISLLELDVAAEGVLDVACHAIEHPEPFRAWSEFESVWRMNGQYLADMAYEAVCDLDPQVLEAAIAGAGGRDAAVRRWPALADFT